MTGAELEQRVARAMRRRRLERANAGPVFLAASDEAPAEPDDVVNALDALAAVAEAAGGDDGLVGAALALRPTGTPDEDTPMEGLDRGVAVLLRALVGRAP